MIPTAEQERRRYFNSGVVLMMGSAATVDHTIPSTGCTTLQISPAPYLELSRKLAPYRPVANATFPCERRRTDSAKYTVTWRQDGAPVALTVDTGCGDERAADLVRMLDGAVGSTGFDRDSAQVTRPGATRD